MTTPKTPNLYLFLPNFNLSPWHDEVNANFRSIDATIRSLFGLTNLLGEYQNSTAVTTGDRFFDTTTGFYYEALSDFTTMASPNTFATERTTYPARWTLIDAAEALDAATNAAASATAAAASATAAAADAVQTAADRVQTGLDVVATNADAVATAADRVQTGLDRTAAATSASEAATSAASINFPDPGVAENYVRRNAGNTAWENRTPEQVLSDAGGIAANQFPSPGAALNILRRNAGNTAYENRTPDQFREDISALKKDGSNVGDDAAKKAFLAAVGIDTSGTEGDIFYRNSVGLLVPITAGSAGQQLRRNAANNGFEWQSDYELIGEASFSDVAQIDITDLGDFEALELSLRYKAVSTSTSLGIRTSTDNGASFAAGATDYYYVGRTTTNSGGGTNASSAAYSTFMLVSWDGAGTGFEININAILPSFNKARDTNCISEAWGSNSGGIPFLAKVQSYRSTAAAFNAIRIVGSANITGAYRLRGLRG